MTDHPTFLLWDAENCYRVVRQHAQDPDQSRIFDFGALVDTCQFILRTPVIPIFLTPDVPHIAPLLGYLQGTGWKVAVITDTTNGDQGVDDCIVRTIDHIVDGGMGSIVVGTHDGATHPGHRSIAHAIADARTRDVACAVAGLREHLGHDLHRLTTQGVQVLDLVDDLRCVTVPLRRPYKTTAKDFDPRRITR
jgi:hypothetical protein